MKDLLKLYLTSKMVTKSFELGTEMCMPPPLIKRAAVRIIYHDVSSSLRTETTRSGRNIYLLDRKPTRMN